MIVGLGVDVVDVNGFREQLSDPASTFLTGTFTEQERGVPARRPARDGIHHLAVRYAAKEAFIKAWSGSRWGREPRMKSGDYSEIEVVQDGWGRPSIRLHGKTREAFESDGLPPAIHLSLSHDGPVAMATVVLDGLPASGEGEGR